MARVKELCDLFHHVFYLNELFLFLLGQLIEGRKAEINTDNVLRCSVFRGSPLPVSQCLLGMNNGEVRVGGKLNEQ